MRNDGLVYSVFVAVGLIVALTNCAAESPSGAASALAVANGDFSDVTSGFPAGWLIDENSRAKGQADVTSGSLRLQPNSKNSDDILAMNVAQAFPVGGLNGAGFELSGRLGAEGGAVATVVASVINGDGEILAAASLVDEGTAGDLRPHTSLLTIPSDESAILLILNCQVRGKSGAAYFDDIGLTPVTQTMAGASGPGNTGEAGATIRINATRDVRSINRGLYGVNVTWPRGGNGILTIRDNTFDSEVLALTKQLRPSLIRYPGGILSDFYDWRDGIGPIGERPNRAPSEQDDEKYPNVFGTNEALEFAKSVGGELLITVNAGTGDARQAAEWVEYVRNQASSNPDYRVKYWEVGNELYLKGEITMPPKRYAQKFLEFAREMRDRDSTIKIGALGSENFFKDVGYEYTYPDWTRHILETAGHEIDFLAIHNAYAPSLLGSGSDKDVRSVYRAMLAAPLLIERDLRRTSAKIREFVPDRADSIKIAITEWGPFFAFDPGNRYMDHVKTLGSALFTASVMQAFLRNAQVEIANFFQLNSLTPLTLIGLAEGTSITDWLEGKDGIYRPNASYYALQMYTRYFGDVLVHSEVTSATFDAPAAGWVEPTNDVPYIDAVASRSADGRKLHVMAINKHFDQDIEVTITIDGFTPERKATTRVLNGTAIDAHPGVGPVVVPGVKWAKPAKLKSNSRFGRGGVAEISVTDGAINVDGSFSHVLPAHSVTAIVLNAK